MENESSPGKRKERARAYGWIFLVAYLIDGFAGVFSPLIGYRVRLGSVLSVIIIFVFVLAFVLRKTLRPQHIFLILPLFQLLSVITLTQKWLTGFVWPLSLIQWTLPATLGIYGVYVFRSAKDASRLKEQPRSTRESMSYIFLGIISICVVTLYFITPFCVVTLYFITPFIEVLDGGWNAMLNFYSYLLLPCYLVIPFCVIKGNKFLILIAEMLLLFLLTGLEYELKPFARRIVFDFNSPELNTFVKEIGDWTEQMTVKGYSGDISFIFPIRGSGTRLGADIGIGSNPNTPVKYSIDEKVYEKFSHKLEKIHCTEFQSKDNYIYFRISGLYNRMPRHSYGWLYLKEDELPKSVDTFRGSFHKLDNKWYFFNSS